MRKKKRKQSIRGILHKMKRKRGQIWTTFAEGLGMLTIVALMFAVMFQVYTFNLKPMVVRYGVNAANANLIESAWDIILIPVVIAFAFAMIEAGRRRPQNYGV